ncbi:minor tail protein [Mycobacterium phage Yeet]|nr:minor tail protein [Mycobacterium phage Ejimix]QBI97484.1 minor tail protein [Mycobacterium phage Hughesyang]QCO93725.1 minor tail protein [Mycobacterium phage Schatzie]QDM57861.1 minor tail protein [Mycobacterium phage NihilNomen]QED12189.1 minor tail protein [Mycobacterium phage Yeet]QQM15199.1 minor tail protein [Mycobacterium phage Pound]WNM72595.1 minor tail protein [Mycobacterium phage Bombitas]
MALTIDGANITFDGRVTVVNGFNPDTGVAYLVLTPEGGFGELPFFSAGTPGLPPEFTEIKMTPVDPADPLPAVNPVMTQVDPGGPGLPSRYKLEFFVHKGDKGDTGSLVIANAEDLATSPALNSSTNKFTLVYRSSDGMWVPTAQRVGNMFISPVISATAHNATPVRQLSHITIEAQPFDWYPKVFAQTQVTGAADTRVDLIARLNDPASGAMVGYSKGLSGVTPPPNVLIPAFSTSSTLPKVSAGNAAVIYLRAEQMAGSSNSWSTPASPDTTFCVEVSPLL